MNKEKSRGKKGGKTGGGQEREVQEKEGWKMEVGKEGGGTKVMSL